MGDFLEILQEFNKYSFTTRNAVEALFLKLQSDADTSRVRSDFFHITVTGPASQNFPRTNCLSTGTSMVNQGVRQQSL